MAAIPRNDDIPPIIQAYVDLNLNILKTHDMGARVEPQTVLPPSVSPLAVAH